MKHLLPIITLLILFSAPLPLSADVGQVLTRTSLDIAEPTGIAFVRGDLWIADRATGNLLKVDPDSGKTLDSIPSPSEAPLGITFDGTSTLYIADDISGVIYVMNLETRETTVIDQPEGKITGVAWDGKYLWATSRRAIMKLDPSDGTEMETHEASGRYPTGISYDGKYLWVSERGEDEIGVYTMEGILFGLLPSHGSFPWGIARDGDRLFVADYQAKELIILDISPPADPTFGDEMHRRTLSFTHQLLNWGPDKITEADIAFAVPKDDIHQKILEGPHFSGDGVQRDVKDQWGQEFALFTGENIENGGRFTARMDVTLESRDTHTFILPEWVKGFDTIPLKYTVDGSKLMIHDPYIQEKAKEIVGNETNPFWIAFKIHRYLMTNMEYKLSGGWNVAPTILKRGNGSCSEFTFAFLALARAAGLPARYEAGIVVRGDDASIDKVYHRWAQVYLPPYGWIPVDPSRGKPTTARKVAKAFGSRSHRFLITTLSGGDSPYLGWTYNSKATYSFKGRAKVEERTWAKWNPDSESGMEDLQYDAQTPQSEGLTLTKSPDNCSVP